ncbi:hypothetical protein CEXT_766901 [Caerostris extrusa]|uniref:Uncharacterized protein n=1 Tax=Caerostris extrusa TaxID=172846 RepID=A0AAV4PAD2_CAEEX|nr:hypothetical protein CEXT_766901 [Caerostris extrusa]
MHRDIFLHFFLGGGAIVIVSSQLGKLRTGFASGVRELTNVCALPFPTNSVSFYYFMISKMHSFNGFPSGITRSFQMGLCVVKFGSYFGVLLCTRQLVRLHIAWLESVRTGQLALPICKQFSFLASFGLSSPPPSKLQQDHPSVNFLQQVIPFVNFLQQVIPSVNFLQQVIPSVNFLQQVIPSVNFLQQVILQQDIIFTSLSSLKNSILKEILCTKNFICKEL